MEIHAIVKVNPIIPNQLVSGIYANQRLKYKKILWNNLKTIANLHFFPWLVIGYFNDVLSQFEKIGGGENLMNSDKVNLFNDDM